MIRCSASRAADENWPKSSSGLSTGAAFGFSRLSSCATCFSNSAMRFADSFASRPASLFLARSFVLTCSSREHQRRLRLSPENVRREVVFGVRRTLGRTCTKAGRDADRAEQATCNARPEGDVRDRGPTQREPFTVLLSSEVRHSDLVGLVQIKKPGVGAASQIPWRYVEQAACRSFRDEQGLF